MSSGLSWKLIFLNAISIVVLSLFSLTVMAQDFWYGPMIEFERPNGADWTLEENQDRITDLVWITRKTTQGIFNIAVEDGYELDVSPIGTEWAYGTLPEVEELEFLQWRAAVNFAPTSMPGEDLVLHLIEEDIYIHVIFSWWQPYSGGGYGYMRSTPGSMSTDDLTPNVKIISDLGAQRLLVSGLNRPTNYSIYSVTGVLVDRGLFNPGEYIDTASLSHGIFVIALDGVGTYNFAQ